MTITLDPETQARLQERTEQTPDALANALLDNYVRSSAFRLTPLFYQ